MIPLSHRRTLLSLQIFRRNSSDTHNEEEEKRLLQEFLDFDNRVIREDEEICLQVQKNLESGIYNAGILSGKYENGVQFFQEVIMQ